MHINSPLPSSLASECRKAARILNSFQDAGNGIDIIIPPNILSNAKGLAIFTVLKAGFLFSGRAGSGLVVARLPDGSWSAPSAIMTGGMGFGGQVGAELTDFIMVLNTTAAVKSFMDHGSITLGGNISVAAGPIGRNAEASGTASFRTLAAVYSYSKTRGLFAGVSLEGSVIIERFDANKKMYGHKVKARDLLTGVIPPPDAAEPLYAALRTKCQSSTNARFGFMERDSFDYRYDDHYDHRDVTQPSPTNRSLSRAAVHQMAKTGTYASPSLGTPSYGTPTYGTPTYGTPRLNANSNDNSSRDLVLSNRDRQMPQVRALFNFKGEQEGDLAFQKGDIITIIKRSNTQNDWWTGRLNGKEGIFPANFVEDIY
ncbi:hypothetical protein G6F70_005624 [Rhizopus microsporus]|uniref:DUF500-domain-containing protein n=1 Tax=Rhizopus microsporus TaxID=58291 RepID=A0A1X0RR64_RHIZD|nr:hypothetical protein G6F71_005434 [Rhizopus microsporus]KAG1198642.1 hypothetical protein G6F70_005624 [Rhizopus microsporus]KAG1210460.1 hypothetical protein G6F69_005458 [Rhizopus microsporus]KAG1232197.1 hypothetical protein G6F67_005193 [Rhizopus microsporus]KAG1264429.1 hypothetical protein G6F68_004353 [Rhizopus microsporus]